MSATKPPAADHPAPAHVEDLHRRLELVLGQPDHVEVLRPVGDHLLASRPPCAPRRAGRAAAPPARTRASSDAACISASRPRQHGLGVAGEEAHEVGHVAVVRLVVDGADARPRAALDVEEQAGPAEPLVPAELGVRAGAHREGPQQQVEGRRGWRPTLP